MTMRIVGTSSFL